jgi:hypothetical protein
MKRTPRKSKSVASKKDQAVGYTDLLNDVACLVDMARKTSARTINAIMTATYWSVGWRIVEHEQGGRRRAEYGEETLKCLSADLGIRFGRGYSLSNVKQFRQFYLAFKGFRNSQTVSDQSVTCSSGNDSEIWQTLSAESDLGEIAALVEGSVDREQKRTKATKGGTACCRPQESQQHADHRS